MNEIALLEHLEELLTRLGVELRYDTLGQLGIRTEGGYCKVAGKPLILVNRRESRRRKIQILAKALNRLDLEGIFIPPGVRRAIESHNN